MLLSCQRLSPHLAADRKRPYPSGSLLGGSAPSDGAAAMAAAAAPLDDDEVVALSQSGAQSKPAPEEPPAKRGLRFS
jgi:cytochrome c553